MLLGSCAVPLPDLLAQEQIQFVINDNNGAKEGYRQSMAHKLNVMSVKG